MNVAAAAAGSRAAPKVCLAEDDPLLARVRTRTRTRTDTQP